MLVVSMCGGIAHAMRASRHLITDMTKAEITGYQGCKGILENELLRNPRGGENRYTSFVVLNKFISISQ